MIIESAGHRSKLPIAAPAAAAIFKLRTTYCAATVTAAPTRLSLPNELELYPPADRPGNGHGSL
jgi:hypothetical protein